MYIYLRYYIGKRARGGVGGGGGCGTINAVVTAWRRRCGVVIIIIITIIIYNNILLYANLCTARSNDHNGAYDSRAPMMTVVDFVCLLCIRARYRVVCNIIIYGARVVVDIVCCAYC